MMARCRVKLARILNESKRKAALKKRKEALIKRLETLCVLCRSEACMVVYDVPSNPEPNDAMVWPSRQEATDMVSKFVNLPEPQKSKKAVTHEEYLENMLEKERNKLQALKRKNDQMEIEEILHKLVHDPDSIDVVSGALARTFLFIQDLIERIKEERK